MDADRCDRSTQFRNANAGILTPLTVLLDHSNSPQRLKRKCGHRVLGGDVEFELAENIARKAGFAADHASRAAHRFRGYLAGSR